jgi:hypothetical protein
LIDPLGRLQDRLRRPIGAADNGRKLPARTRGLLGAVGSTPSAVIPLRVRSTAA